MKMMHKTSTLLILIAMVLVGACKIRTIQHEPIHFRLLTKEEAAKAVVKDSMESYFDKVTLLEMSIQLKINAPSGTREDIIADYKKLLQEDLLDFTTKEQKELKQIFQQALDYCTKIKKDLNLPEIHLIKTKGNYYGSSVFYTREHCIVIPAKQLGNNETLLRTLIHEIFHIYSRYNKDKRDALYAAIGYHKLGTVELSNFLKERILYNPDGVDIAYAIEVVDTNNQKIMVIPAIYTKFSSYRMIPLMRTMIFQLFEVQKKGDKWSIVTEQTGYGEDQILNYWAQIGENTRYTIHPDEILADNFVFLALSKARGDAILAQFDNKGRALIRKIEVIINE